MKSIAVAATFVAVAVLMSTSIPVCLAASTCSSISSLTTAANTACGVTTITDLHQFDLLTDRSPRFCNSSCVLAVTSLKAAVDGCVSVDAAFAAAVGSIFGQQTQCLPPNAKCLMDMRNFLRWEQQTEVGVACVAARATFATLPANATSQATIAAHCSGTCGSASQYYLGLLETHGCAAWRAYRVKKLDYLYSCSADGSDRCPLVFSTQRMDSTIDSIKNPSNSLTTRDNLLQSLCTPCFYQYLRLGASYGSDLTPLKNLEYLCVRDDNKFCYPRFTAIEANITSTPLYQSLQQFCAADNMGKCAAKMFGRQIRKDTLSAQEVTKREQHVRYMCTRSESDQLCASLMNDPIAGFNASGQFMGSYYLGPTPCSQLASGNYCLWGCQREFSVARDSYGCCYETYQTYLKAIDMQNVDAAFGHLDVAASECDRPVNSPCMLLGEKTEKKLSITVKVPIDFVSSQNGLKAQIESELEVLLGRPAESVVVNAWSGDASSSVIEFTIKDQSAGLVSQTAQNLQRDVASSAIVFFTAESSYGARCTGSACNAAALLLPSVVVMALCLLFNYVL